MPVDDSGQVHEAAQYRHIGDVSAPDLVDMRNRQIAQEIGIAFMPLAQRITASPGVDRMNAHKTHQPSDPFATDRVAQPAGISNYLAPAIEGRAQVLLINQAHQMQVQR